MKFILLAVFACCIFSCTKTKTNTVTVTKNDTTVTMVVDTPTLVGTWNSTTGVSPITFTDSTYQVQTNAAIPYVTNATTIYDISPANIVYEQWTYQISSNNDTLYLTAFVPSGSATNTYIRN